MSKWASVTGAETDALRSVADVKGKFEPAPKRMSVRERLRKAEFELQIVTHERDRVIEQRDRLRKHVTDLEAIIDLYQKAHGHVP